MKSMRSMRSILKSEKEVQYDEEDGEEYEVDQEKEQKKEYEEFEEDDNDVTAWLDYNSVVILLDDDMLASGLIHLFGQMIHLHVHLVLSPVWR